MIHKCCHCGVNLAKAKHYLVVHGVMLLYCEAIECQTSMKRTSKEFDENGIFAKVVEL